MPDEKWWPDSAGNDAGHDAAGQTRHQENIIVDFQDFDFHESALK